MAYQNYLLQALAHINQFTEIIMDKHVYLTKKGHGLKHNPFNSIVAPRPIGWVSTMGQDCIANLAPYSFFNAFNYSPPIIGFSSIGYKDSVANIEETGEFCWNFVNRPLAHQMNMSSANIDRDADEFEFASLVKGVSHVVRPPHVQESPVIMECVKTQIVQLKDNESNHIVIYMVFGEVVAVHIDKSVIEDGVFSLIKAQPVIRGGGPNDYFTLSESQRLNIDRPK